LVDRKNETGYNDLYIFYFDFYMSQYVLRQQIEQTDGLILPLCEGELSASGVGDFVGEYVDLVQAVSETNDFEEKKGQVSVLYTGEKKLPRVVLVGLGKQEEMSVRKWKQALGTAVLALQQKKARQISLVIPTHIIDLLGQKKAAYETVLACELSQYCYDDHRAKDMRTVVINTVDILVRVKPAEKKEWEQGVAEALAVSAAVNMTRQLGNTPPSHMTPTALAKEARALQTIISKSLHVKILEKKDMEKLGMGCLLAVASGSTEAPKFIIVEYLGGKKKAAPTVLVGKGITFDSGGLSIKSGDFMVDMKYDMLGGATVLGILRAAAALKLKKNIIGLIPACENMPSGSAYRPDDILTAMNGKTVLVENTDAEGRLILADALCYASRYKPKEVIDFATLTGACVVALGNERSGLFTQSDELADGLDEAARAAGEQLWRLPLGEEYTEAIKADVADLKNMGGVGGSRYAGASTAAAFLEYFTNYPWAHIDLSSSYWGPKGKSYIRGGANGFGVQMMVEYLKK
jgi:leucyl aminopeptidase